MCHNSARENNEIKEVKIMSMSDYLNEIRTEKLIKEREVKINQILNEEDTTNN